MKTYLRRRDSPDLEVVGSHEDLIQTLANISNVPIIKVARLISWSSNAGFESSVNETAQTFCLFLLRKYRNVILEWVRNPDVLVTDVGDSLMFVPVRGFGEGLVQAVVEVLVMGEDDVSANVK